jgi:hypothetical protein
LFGKASLTFKNVEALLRGLQEVAAYRQKRDANEFPAQSLCNLTTLPMA